jgi:hypothetical protein
MMGAVAVVAFACAALRSASDLWASTALTLAVSLLFVALLGVLFRRGESRAFWTGGALFGWGYLLLVFGPWFNTNVAPHLLSTKLLGFVFENAHSTPASVLVAGAGSGVAYGDLDGDGWVDLYVSNLPNASPMEVTRRLRTPTVLYRDLGNGQFVNVTATALGIVPGATSENFYRVGHSLLALALALSGGLLARWFYAARGERDVTQGAHPSLKQPDIPVPAENISASALTEIVEANTKEARP